MEIFNTNEAKQKSWNTCKDCAWCFIEVVLILLALYRLYGYAPFGNKSLAWADASIQYMDFFAYLKDVIMGKNSIDYTFGKTLGGTNIATFSYYLASPWNFLVIFFEKSQLHTFFDLLVVIKLGIAAVTMRFFVGERWKNYISDMQQRSLASLFSSCYALCQYSIAQSSNVMWLDGVYFLPLILLGVYRVSQGKSGLLLSITVGFSILFNWYTGGINCLASIIWIFWEILLKKVEKENDVLDWKDLGYRFWQYIYSMILGVLLSACLFLPTIYALKKSSRGNFEWSRLKDFGFNGPFVSVIEGFSLGAISTNQKVSLFCGSFIIIGFMAIFFEKKIAARLKIVFGILIVSTILMFYWKPAFLVFSLLKDASSYWYRYSYVGIFFLIFVAAQYYLRYVDNESWYSIIKAGVCWTLLMLLVNYAKGEQTYDRVQYTVLLINIFAALLACCFYYRTKGKAQFVSLVSLSVMALIELSWSAKFQMSNYHYLGVDTFKDYSVAAQQQTDEIKRMDDDFYRVTQTSTYNTRVHGTTANYNEALAYNYWSISGYTSSPDDIQRTLMDRLGYRINGENMCIVNTSVISADSLLGVKYILSKKAINGYSVVGQRKYNEKSLYKNPYVLPMAFTYTNNTFEADSNQNPFEYQNQLYSQFMGKKVSIFKPVKYSCQFDGKGQPTYTLSVQKGNYALYGNLPWNSEFHGIIQNADGSAIDYACWLSPSVFYIPHKTDQTEVLLAITADNKCDLKYGEEQFYALDLDVLAQISETLNKKAAKYTFQNGKVRILAKSNGNENLYISVPYDSGWTVTVDGKRTETKLFADCMYLIQLSAGEHEILMKYHVEGQIVGIIGSLLGLIGIIGREWNWRRKKCDK